MKRFIAGAICSACQSIDRIVLYENKQQRWHQCILCGHTETMPNSDQSTEKHPSEQIKIIQL
ncbi:MAG: YheV family putative metal-binding protein [Endozoicomonadaceae bacterium]|nr:YheV family putative metal-binding protein [Endozoicomonadaceae bacterium]MBE8232657.1 YheV family putative metal-binding protein [Endozoicomonadaceae bacterium]